MSSLLRPAQLAPLLGLSTRALIRAAARGEVPSSQTPGGHRRFDPGAVAATMRSRGLAVPFTLEPPALIPLPEVVRRVFVAGPSSEFRRCGAVIERIVRAGLSVTFDWPPVVREVRAGRPAPSDHEQAAGCLAGVAEADILLFLLPSPAYLTVGAWVELGAAIALRKPVAVSCGNAGLHSFGGAPYSSLVHLYPTDRIAIAELLSRAPKV